MKPSQAWFVVACVSALHVGCGGSAPAPAKAVASRSQSQPAAPSASTETRAESEGSELAPEVQAMLTPRTCNPNLLSSSHFQEFSDGKGGKHRAFLIKPGEQLCLVRPGDEAELSELELSEDPVPLTEAKGRLIAVELENLATGVVLVVKNHYPQTLQYRVGMRLPNQLDLVHTSSCPVRPGLFGVEQWPEKPDGLVLMDFSLHDRAEHLSCE